jgi:hypothetical protein
VELCALESEDDDDDEKKEGKSGGGRSGSKNESKTETRKITSVWAVAVADGKLFDAPMRLSNATAAVLRFSGSGNGGKAESPPLPLSRLLPPVDLSDAGAPAAAPPAFSFSSSSSSSPIPFPEPTVSHDLTIRFNKQKGFVESEGEGEEAKGKEEEVKNNNSNTTTKGPLYFVEGHSQRPRGLDDPRRPSLLEVVKRRAAAAAMAVTEENSSSKEGEGREGGKEVEGEGEEELQKSWNLFRHPLGAVVELLLRNDDDAEHSFHLHGHNIWVVGEGEETEGKGKRRKIGEARDTVLIPSKSEIRVRYVADSPGVFLAHCHMSWHESAGLGVVMVDGVK